MGIIRKLPDMVANKIAAGEVIERPASVIKELVENAIDAEASRIEVELEDGGKRLIRVSDNGTGMAAEDLAMAVESHATSKLKDSSDLFFITTLGFRGEALPSIGAVAELRIASRLRQRQRKENRDEDDKSTEKAEDQKSEAEGGGPKADGQKESQQPPVPDTQNSALITHHSPPPCFLQGAEIEVLGGKIAPIKAAGVPEGTIIEVRNLFFNIPARRKFLKTSSTELSHAVDIITKMALAYPSVSFKLTHNGREVIACLQNEDRLRRIANFFGKELQGELLEVNAAHGPLTIHGYIAPPSQTRANAKLQYIFLNGRFIRDKTVASAIRDAYSATLPAGRQPIVVLFLQIDPREVDVNVHPTKYEVRFRDGHLVYSGVRRIIVDRLASAATPEVRLFAAPAAEDGMTGGRDDGMTGGRDDGRTGGRDDGGNVRPDSANHPAPPAGTQHSSLITHHSSLITHHSQARPAAADWSKKIRRDPGLFQVSYQPPADGLSSTPPVLPSSRPPVSPAALRLNAFQVHDSYIVEETADGIRIIDQHALHERILYNQIRKRLESAALESQRLLIPVTAELTSDEVILLGGAGAELRALGFEIEEFGRNTVAVRAVPTVLLDCDPEQFLHELIAQLQEEGPKPETQDRQKAEGRGLKAESPEQSPGRSASGPQPSAFSPQPSPREPSAFTPQPAARDNMMKMIACKAAVKAGQRLTSAEIASLLQKARQLGGAAATCPHGRPTSIALSREELEKHFLRR